ncbi:MAG: hypothetical protein ACLRXC_02870 [[Clostridium] leptum]
MTGWAVFLFFHTAGQKKGLKEHAKYFSAGKQEDAFLKSNKTETIKNKIFLNYTHKTKTSGIPLTPGGKFIHTKRSPFSHFDALF